MASRRQRRKANKLRFGVPGYSHGGQVGIQNDEAIIRNTFNARGLDGNFAVEVARNEGLYTHTGDGGHSHGVFQLYDQGLLPDFYAKGYTDPYNVQQAAEYTANYVATNRNWGPWHGARSLYASGMRPSDGSRYDDASGVSYDGGGGNPTGGGGYPNLPPTGSGGSSDPSTWTREEWAYVVALDSERPPGLTDAEWQYIILAEADRRQRAYVATNFGNMGPNYDGGGGAPPSGGDPYGGGGDPYGGGSTGGGGSSTGRGGTSYSQSSSSSYNVQETGPVAADIARRQNEIDAERNRIQETLGRLELDIARLRAYADISSQNRADGLAEQQFVYQQQLDELNYELELLDLAAVLRSQDVTLRGQDLDALLASLRANVDVRGQDIDAQIEGINAQIRYWSERRQDAIDRGNLQLQQEAEARLRAEMENRNSLLEREQDIALRDQDMNAALRYGQLMLDGWAEQVEWAKNVGDYNLQRHAEERLLGAQQQNAALDAYAQQLAASGQRIEGEDAAAGRFGDLATLEQQRQEFLSELLSNPRDFAQYQFAMGRGQSFMDNLLQGKPFQGMTIGNAAEAGIPLLGSQFGELLNTLQDRPAWEAAMDAARRIQEATGQIPHAPTIQEILALMGEVSPLEDLGDMPEMPTLPDPFQFDRPGPIEFVSPPPQGALPGPVEGPGTFTAQMAEAEVRDKIAAARAAGQMPTSAQINQWRVAAMAKVGTTDWSYFNPTVPDIDTNIDMPTQPPPIGGADLWTASEAAALVQQRIAQYQQQNNGQNPPQSLIGQWRQEAEELIGTPRPVTGYMPTAPDFPSPVSPYPDPSVLPPPTSGGGTPPPASGGTPPPTSGGGAPPPTGGGTYQPPATGSTPTGGYQPPSSSGPYNPVFQPTIPPGMADRGRAIIDRINQYRNAQGGAQIVDEPTTAYGDITGEPKFTLGERTPGFPQGIPERVEVSPDGQMVDIQPFGQEPASAASNILQSAVERFRSAGSFDEKRNVLMEMMQSLRPVMGFPEDMSQRMDLHRIQSGGASPKERDYLNAVSPTEEPMGEASRFPDFVSGLIGDTQGVPQATKKMKRIAREVVGRRR